MTEGGMEGEKEAMKSSTKVLCIGLVVLVLLGAGGIALAEGTPPAKVGTLLRGRVAGRSADGFTLGTRRGDVTISVSADTRYRVPGISHASLDDIEVGDQVLVRVRKDAAGSLSAAAVVVLPPVPIGGLKGQVTAVQGTTISLQVGSEVKIVLTDEKTRYHVPGKESATLADVRVGDTALVSAPREPGGALLARRVVVLPEDARGLSTLRGRVTELDGSELRLQAGENRVAIAVSAKTRIRVPGVRRATLTHIRVGDWLLVVGKPTGPSRLEAQAIAVLPPVSIERFAVRGEVMSVEGTTLTVQEARHLHTVRTDSLTRFRIAGVENPSINDVHAGDRVAAVGMPGDGGAMSARRVIVRRAEASTASQAGQDSPPELHQM